MKVVYYGPPLPFVKLIYRMLLIISGAVLIIVIFALLFDVTDFTERDSRCNLSMGKNCRNVIGSTPKIILLWTPLYGQMKHWDWWFSNSEREKRCPQIDCILTTNRSRLTESDAVVFHVYDQNFNLQDLPPKRTERQRWVFFTTEPPELTKDYSQLNNLFNWTMTYRLDADIPIPYGWLKLEAQNSNSLIPYNYAAGKNKLVAWFVTHCNTESGRETYIKELQHYISVDIFGPCGSLTCQPPRSDACYQMLNKDYKFYLAFENILCKDYVTEKFFNMLKLNVVPIAFGGGDYNSFVSDSAYIDALRFSSPKELAEFLLKVDTDDDLYNGYFKWKNGLSVNIEMPENTMACKLCQKTSEDDYQMKIYKNIEDWWFVEGNCKGWDINNSLHLIEGLNK